MLRQALSDGLWWIAVGESALFGLLLILLLVGAGGSAPASGQAPGLHPWGAFLLPVWAWWLASALLGCFCVFGAGAMGSILLLDLPRVMRGLPKPKPSADDIQFALMHPLMVLTSARDLPLSLDLGKARGAKAHRTVDLGQVRRDDGQPPPGPGQIAATTARSLGRFALRCLRALASTARQAVPRIRTIGGRVPDAQSVPEPAEGSNPFEIRPARPRPVPTARTARTASPAGEAASTMAGETSRAARGLPDAATAGRLGDTQVFAHRRDLAVNTHLDDSPEGFEGAGGSESPSPRATIRLAGQASPAPAARATDAPPADAPRTSTPPAPSPGGMPPPADGQNAPGASQAQPAEKRPSPDAPTTPAAPSASTSSPTPEATGASTAPTVRLPRIPGMPAAEAPGRLPLIERPAPSTSAQARRGPRPAESAYRFDALQQLRKYVLARGQDDGTDQGDGTPAEASRPTPDPQRTAEVLESLRPGAAGVFNLLAEMLRPAPALRRVELPARLRRRRDPRDMPDEAPLAAPKAPDPPRAGEPSCELEPAAVPADRDRWDPPRADRPAWEAGNLPWDEALARARAQAQTQAIAANSNGCPDDVDVPRRGGVVESDDESAVESDDESAVQRDAKPAVERENEPAIDSPGDLPVAVEGAGKDQTGDDHLAIGEPDPAPGEEEAVDDPPQRTARRALPAGRARRAHHWESVMIRCPGCGRQGPSPGERKVRCSDCGLAFRVTADDQAVVDAQCPGCGRSRPVDRLGRFQCSACSSVFHLDAEGSRLEGRCPGCGKTRPVPSAGRYQCSACRTVFRVGAELPAG
jgi:hypothetical protein